MSEKSEKRHFFDGVDRDAVNQTAGRVIKKGTRFESRGKFQQAMWESCPPVWGEQWHKRMNIPNLAGIQFGRFTVIGLAKNIPKRWIVRCACGTFATRTAKAIRNQANNEDRCENCRKTQFANHRHNRRTHFPEQSKPATPYLTSPAAP